MRKPPYPSSMKITHKFVWNIKKWEKIRQSEYKGAFAIYTKVDN